MDRTYPGSLHNHTEYSNLRLRDCIIHIDRALDYAEELGHEVIAFTDHEFVGSWIRIEEKKESHPNLKVIYGNEIYLCRNGLNGSNFVSEQDKYFHFVLLAKDATGAEQIRQLSTRAWNRSYMARGLRRVPTYYQDLVDIIGPNPGHIYGLSACLGGCLPTQLLRYKESKDEGLLEKIKQWCLQIESIFGKNKFYFELQPSASTEQTYVNRELIRLSQQLNIPYVITTDSHYYQKSDQVLHATYLNAQDGDREVSSFYATTYMMDTVELESHLDLTEQELEVAYENIRKIYQNCEEFSNKRPLIIPRLAWKIPTLTGIDPIWYERIPMLKTFVESDYEGDKIMAFHIVEKLESDPTLQNKETWAAVEDNLDKTWESSIINKAHWSAYFLNLQGIIDVCWDAGTLVGCGRGCFTPGNKVLMADGREKNIELVNPGDIVFSCNGKKQRVEKRLEYDCDEILYRIFPKTDTHNPITCTNNHKIWGMKSHSCPYNGKYCSKTCSRRSCQYRAGFEKGWIKAEDLTEADFLFYPRPEYQPKPFDKFDLTEYLLHSEQYIITDQEIINSKGRKISRFIPLNKEFLYVLGVAIGKGWTSSESKKSYLGIAFNAEQEKDRNSMERCVLFFESLGLPVSLIKHKQKKLIQMYIYSAPIGLFFEKLMGHGVESKHIPQEVLYDNKEDMYGLFEGLMASDGSYDTTSLRISYDGINHNLISQIKNLWAYLGIYGSVTTRLVHGNDKTSYKLRASGQQLNWLIEKNSLIFQKPSKQSSNLLIEDDGFYFRIEKIETAPYQGKVYDLTVSQDHSYIINNIGVHNSGVGFILLYILGIIQINPLREKIQTYSFRFLNPNRVSVVDCDTDIEGGRRAKVLEELRRTYGQDRVANVATFRTEKPKACILTACRGLGLNPDIGQYLSSLIPVERGESRTLEQCMYGDSDKGFAPVKQFVYEMTENYPEVWETASKISGLVCGYGIHAGGVIFVDEPFEKSTALMRAPDGTVITQYELHDAEKASLIKIDLLSVEATDKLHICLDLLCEYGYVERKPTLRETYEDVIGIYKLEREDKEMWKLIWEHKIASLFQMEKDSGIKGIALTLPNSVEDLAHLNSIIRLMPQEKGGEMPIDKYTRFKNDIDQWFDEMISYGLTANEIEILKPILLESYGICESQETFMRLLQVPECGGFDLTFADKVRRAIAKKNAKDYEALTQTYFEECEKKGLSKNLCNYVWNVLVATSRGYAFE